MNWNSGSDPLEPNSKSYRDRAMTRPEYLLEAYVSPILSMLSPSCPNMCSRFIYAVR